MIENLSDIPKKNQEYFLDYIKMAPDSLIEKMKLKKMSEGTVFIRENDEINYVYILLDGVVRAVDYRMHGVPYEFMRFYPVNMLGSMEIVLNLKKYCTTLVTETKCTFFVCPISDFSAWLLNDLNAIRTEAQVVVRYLLEEDRQNRLFLLLQGKDRLFVVLMQYYEKYAVNGKCLVKLTRMELSDRTRLSLRTINRTIKQMEDMGYIGKRTSKITINKEQYEQISAYISKQIN